MKKYGYSILLSVILTVSLVLIITIISSNQAYGVSMSATMSYSVTHSGSVYNYTLKLTNTTPADYYISGFLFGAQYNVTTPAAGPLADIVMISSVGVPPNQWYCFADGTNDNFLRCQGPNYFGTFPVPNTIAPGESKQFVFSSTTPPPRSMVFGVNFLINNPFSTGHTFNGIASYHGPIMNDILNQICSVHREVCPDILNLPIFVYTDKPSYDHNSTIIVNGHVNKLYGNQDVTLKITSPSGNIISVRHLTVDENGNFITTVNTGSSLMLENDNYTIYVQQGDQKLSTYQTTFTLLSSIPEFGPMVGAVSILSIIVILVISRNRKTRIRF